MVKAGKRNSAAAAAFPVMVVPSKTDHQLKSLLDYGDNLEVCNRSVVYAAGIPLDSSYLTI